MSYLGIATGFMLILIGLAGMLLKGNLIRMIIGFSIMDTGIHVLMVSIAWINGRTAPILDEAVGIENALQRVVDPVPQALVLTAIVIGLGITALLLSFAVKMYEKRKTLEINKFEDLKW